MFVVISSLIFLIPHEVLIDIQSKSTADNGAFLVPNSILLFAYAADLYREAFATAAGAARVGILKLETFTVEPVGKVEFGTRQIQQALAVDDNLDAFVFDDVVGWLLRRIELQVVHQP